MMGKKRHISAFLKSFSVALFICFCLSFALMAINYMRSGGMPTTLDSLELHSISILVEPVYTESVSGDGNILEDNGSDEASPSLQEENAPKLSAPEVSMTRTEYGDIASYLDGKSDSLTTPFEAFSLNPVNLSSQLLGTVSIIVLDIGLSNNLTKAALSDLPPYVTFALSPYAKEAATLAERARSLGFEVWQKGESNVGNIIKHDGGALGLLKNTPAEINREKLYKILGRVDGEVPGLIIDKQVERPLSELLSKEIRDRGYALAGYQKENNYFYIPQFLPQSELQERLARIEEEMFNRGILSLVIEPSLSHFNTLQTWSETLEAKRLAIVPLSSHLAPQ